MKNQQHQLAKELFLDTNLSKTEISERVGVDRRTIRIWSQDGNWESLRRSSRHLPSMVAEKCYYLIDQYASHLLSANGTMSTFSHKDAHAINELASSIKKLKARSAVNESMEMFNFFLEDVKRKDQAVAETISPFIEDYLTNRKNITIADFQLSGFDQYGNRTWADEEKEIKERWADEKDDELYREEVIAARKALTQKEEPQPTPEEQNTLDRIARYKKIDREASTRNTTPPHNDEPGEALQHESNTTPPPPATPAEASSAEYFSAPEPQHWLHQYAYTHPNINIEDLAAHTQPPSDENADNSTNAQNELSSGACRTIGSDSPRKHCHRELAERSDNLHKTGYFRDIPTPQHATTT